MNIDKSKVLKGLFTSQSRIDILNLFFKHGFEEIYMSMLKKKYGKNLSSYQKELQNLLDIDALKEYKSGKLRIFRLNTSFVFYNELKSIFTKTEISERSIPEILAEFPDVNYSFMYDKFVPEQNAYESVLMIVIDDGSGTKDRLRKDINECIEKTLLKYKFKVIEKTELSRLVMQKDPDTLEAINSDKQMIYSKN